MSAFLAAGYEGTSSASSPYSAESSPLPSQLASHPTTDQHFPTRIVHSPSHSQLELQHQHYQAQLQLHHLQIQKQRQLTNETIVQQQQAALPLAPLQQQQPPSTASINALSSTALANTLQHSYTTLNSTTPTPSNNFALHSLSSALDPATSYPDQPSSSITSASPSTLAGSTAALPSMDILSTTPFPEPAATHVHHNPFPQPFVVSRSIARSQPQHSMPHDMQQSHTPVVMAPAPQLIQHSYHDDQGRVAQTGSASTTVLSTQSSTHQQSLQYSMSTSNGALFADDDFLRRMSHSSVGSDTTHRLLDGIDSHVKLEQPFAIPPPGYKLDARIIQKKDQIEELSTPGYKAPARSVEEVRTGQQFLIKLQFLRTDGSHATEYPTMRLERRNAINTSGGPASEPEALTLDIVVRLEKSGQVRRGACAKCCHKYGPSSPILLLLDPLSPSPTDPAMYSHIDIYTGSLTLLAKVICSSTDHSERGNKDKYIFEFRVRRTNAVSPTTDGMRSSLSPGLNDGSDTAGDVPGGSGEILASCTTTPVMCSGHHKAKRLLVDSRVEKASRGVPTPKTKIIQRRKNAEGSLSPPRVVTDVDNSSEEMSTPAPMSHSPSSYPATSLAVTPSMLDVQMIGHDGQSPLSSQPLFPLLPEASPHLSSQSQYQQLNDYVSVPSQLDSSLITASSSTVTTSTTRSSFSSASALPLSSPTIVEIRPDSGPIRKVVHVAIRGMSFREGMVPYFGCFPATDIVVETSRLILCRVPESPLPGTVPVTICEGVSTSYTNLSKFTYTDDNETELLILQLQLRMAHRALEYLHAQATGQQGTAADILRNIPTHQSSPPPNHGGGGSHTSYASTHNFTDGRELDRRPLTLEQVEQGLLKTIEHLPMDIDLSMQLEDGSNLLHLSSLMGFTKLALELIHLGCEIEARDKWGFTPLMYAAFKGHVEIVRALVLAGASAGGARTPEEFYSRLGRIIPRVAEISILLNTACSRYQPQEAFQWLPGLVHPIYEGEDDEMLDDTEGSETTPPSAAAVSAAGSAINVTTGDQAVLSRLPRLLEGLHVLTAIPPHRQQSLPLLQDAIIEEESGALSPRTIMSTQIADEPEDMAVQSPTSKQDASTANVDDTGVAGAVVGEQQQESGYHSGVISEVQDRLKEMHRQQLPATGVEMAVRLRRLETSSAMLASSSSIIAETVAASLGHTSSSQSKSSSPSSVATESPSMNSPFRTSDYFAFDIELTANPMEAEGHVLPSEYLGLRFPHELVKRTSGKAPPLLDEMTYDLKCAVELGPQPQRQGSSSSSTQQQSEPPTLVTGACKECSKWLHEQGKLSPSRSGTKNREWYPVLQFGIPMSQNHHHQQQQQQPAAAASAGTPSPQQQVGGVMEAREGRCEVKARVNCSSIHHLVNREKERFLAIKREREQLMARLKQEGSSEYDPQWKTKLQEEANRTIRDLKDPGYVFNFEIAHPITKEVVATARTAPMVFRTFQRRK